MTRPSFWQSFSRAQVSSFLATTVDFGLLFGLTELCHVWYVPSVAIGAFAGAVTNFELNRGWSFRAPHVQAGGRGPQFARYIAVSAGSLVLNTLGTWAVTEQFHIPYGYSVAGVSLIVGLVFNFPLHRAYVFR